MRSKKIKFPGLTWPLIVGILIMAGCDRGSSVGPGNSNGNGNTPLNNVYFTMEGEDADALLDIQKNGTPQFYGTLSPPWTSSTIPARRNDLFNMEICNSSGHAFELRMFLNGEQIFGFIHNGQNECTEETVTLDQTYNNLLFD